MERVEDRILRRHDTAAELIGAHDWTASPLGPPSNWPTSLQVALSICLESSFPTALYYGDDLRLVYNDAWAPVPADRHPWAFGRPAAEVWQDIWGVVGPQFADVRRTGRGFSTFDQMLPMRREGQVEETYWNYSFTPIRGDDGTVIAILNQGHETTARVLAERRQTFRVDLDRTLRELDDPVQIMCGVAELIGRRLGVGRAGYGELDAASEIIRVEQDWAMGMPSLAGEARLLDDFGAAIAEQLRAGQTVVVNDRATDRRAVGAGVVETWASIDLCAVVAVPVIKQGRFRAFLYLHEPHPRAWTREDVALAEEIAERTWSAVEKARIEQDLRRNEQRLAAIFDSATVGLSEVSLDGRFLRVNDELCRILARQPADLVGRTITEVTHPDDVERSLEAIAAASGSGSVASLDKRYRRPDGTIVWANSRATLLAEADGLAANLLVVTMDLTQRKAAEERLRESEARFRLMADAVPQIVWITDADGRTEFFNKQWTDFTGTAYEPSTAAAIARDHVHPDDAAATMQAFDTARQTGGTFLVEHRIRAASGAYRWFLVRGEPHRDPDTGRIVRWFGASVDIDDRKMAEDALRRINADLEKEVIERTRERGLFWQHSLDLLSVIDLRSKTFDAVNPAWSTTLGWSSDEMIGRAFADFVHPEDGNRSRSAYGDVLAGKPVLHFENRYRTKVGDWRWLSWVAVPEGGKLYSITRDVTDEKHRLAELEAAQAALRQSQKMEAMGQLTGGVAHDFNNLLTPIIGSLDLLQRKQLGGEREQRLIAGAMQSADRAKTLVQRLLAFARRQPLQPIAIDVGELIGNMAELVTSTTGPQIKVVVDIAPGLSAAKADPNQLEMAILNLAVNARDAMPEGGTLRISATEAPTSPASPSRLRAGSYVRLSVADTGIGMDEETVARAIEPFFSTKGIGKGTGLGLSMAHGLALQSGGALTISSRPGLGTNIELWLPVSEAAPEATSSDGSGTTGRVGGRKVLLVDDEELVRASTADMLMDTGFDVVEVASGEAALELIRGGQAFDVLITDHLMPGMTGTDLVQAVRSLVPDMPALLVSGYAEQHGIGHGLPRLTKPFRQDELAASLAQLLGTIGTFR